MEGGDEMEGGDVMSSELPTFSCRLSQFSYIQCFLVSIGCNIRNNC